MPDAITPSRSAPQAARADPGARRSSPRQLAFFRTDGEVALGEGIEGLVFRTEMDLKDDLVGRSEVVERNKLGSGGVDPIPALGR